MTALIRGGKGWGMFEFLRVVELEMSENDSRLLYVVFVHIVNE